MQGRPLLEPASGKISERCSCALGLRIKAKANKLHEIKRRETDVARVIT